MYRYVICIWCNNKSNYAQRIPSLLAHTHTGMHCSKTNVQLFIHIFMALISNAFKWTSSRHTKCFELYKYTYGFYIQLYIYIYVCVSMCLATAFPRAPFRSSLCFKRCFAAFPCHFHAPLHSTSLHIAHQTEQSLHVYDVFTYCVAFAHLTGIFLLLFQF